MKSTNGSSGNESENKKQKGIRAQRKRDDGVHLMNDWMREISPGIADVMRPTVEASADRNSANYEGSPEPASTPYNEKSTEGGEVVIRPRPPLELSPVQSLSAKELEDRVLITIGAPNSMACSVKESDARLMIVGNAHKLMNTKVQAVSDAISDLTQQLLKVERDHLHKANVQMIEKGTWQLSMGWETSIPANYVGSGKGDVLHECITIFNDVLCSVEKWDDKILDAHREGGPKYVAILAAKKLRAAKAGAQLPANCKVECSVLSSAVAMGELIGPAPEEKKRKEVATLTGAFRGYHFDERKSFFSLVESKGGKTKTLAFTEEKFDRIHALATDEFTQCSVDVIMHLFGEQLDHIELLEIKGDTKDMYAGGGQEAQA